MKKLFAMLLALVMVMSLATVAFAAEGDAEPTTGLVSDPVAAAIKLNKIYTVTGAETEGLYPAETLSFTVEAVEGNPSTAMVTVDDLEVEGATDQVININLPVYDTVGIYEYTITEDAGNALGVGYTEDEINVKVLVTYDYEAGKLDTEIVLSTETEDGKLDTFTNTFDLGSLSVTKEVTGNLASQDDEFDVTVTFAVPQGKEVKNDIKYSVAGGDPVTVAAADIEEPIIITLSHGDTVTFVDLPAGLTYTVEEADYTEGGVNDENAGYDEPEYTNEEGTIVTDELIEATIVNNKETEVNTGIVMDSMPYVLMLAVAACGLVMFTTKKRIAE